jgi:hypothetical protein
VENSCRRRTGICWALGAFGRTWSRLAESAWTIPAAILIGVVGPRIYMNVRPPDPLPYGFAEYSPESFTAAQTDGGVLLVDVYTRWCSTCLVQHRALDSLLADPHYRVVRGFRADFDHNREFRERHGVTVQSTILLFDGSRELSRSVGLVREAAIRAQRDEALRQMAADGP